MHRIPAARRHLRVTDPELVCAATASPDDVELTRRWADLLALLGEPGRLGLLQALHRAGELCVSDLAVATGLNRSGVSHALRLLRTPVER